MTDSVRRPIRGLEPAWWVSRAARPLLIVVGWTAFAVAVSVSYAVRDDAPLVVPFRNRLAHVLPYYWIWAALTPVVLGAARRIRERIPNRAGAGAALAVTGVLVNLVQLIGYLPISLTIGRQWGTEPFGAHLGSAIVRHGPGNFLLFAALTVLISALDYRRRMIADLARARLDALRTQLQPHFLFNALQTTVSLIRQDPAAAEAMIERLAEFLRLVLRRDDRHLVPLRDELALLDHYLAVMKLRFGPRLEIAIDVEPGLGDCEVPVLLLQPLVENALQHGVVRRAGAGRVGVSIRRSSEGMVIRIEDDGPGPDPRSSAAPSDRIGLANTQARLAALFGTAFRIELRSGPAGTAVEVEVPRVRGDAQASKVRTAAE